MSWQAAFGMTNAVMLAGWLLLLLGRIIAQGHTAFYTHTVTVPVFMDPARVDRAYPQGSNFEQLAAEQQLARMGIQDDAAGTKAAQMKRLFSSELKFVAADLVAKRGEVIGETVPLAVPLSDDADLYLKGEISKDTPEDQRRLTDQQIAWLDRMKSNGVIGAHFNTALFTNGDSTQPELAGVLGAVVGSALMLMVTALIAIPLGVGAAVWLEEFAPKNKLTDIIEVNINNLAAVPSIVYGLWGAQVLGPLLSEDVAAVAPIARAARVSASSWCTTAAPASPRRSCRFDSPRSRPASARKRDRRGATRAA